MRNKMRLDVAIVGGGGFSSHGSVVFAKGLLLGYIRIQVQEVLQIRNDVSQRTNGKSLAREGLQHEHITLIPS